jgi:hypothetical protein
VDHVALSASQDGEQPLGISAGQVFFRRLGRQYVKEIVNRQFDMAAATAQTIDQLMARDRRHPRCNCFALIPSLPLQVDGQQRLLYDVFDIAIHESRTKAAAHYLPQKRCQSL